MLLVPAAQRLSSGTCNRRRTRTQPTPTPPARPAREQDSARGPARHRLRASSSAQAGTTGGRPARHPQQPRSVARRAWMPQEAAATPTAAHRPTDRRWGTPSCRAGRRGWAREPLTLTLRSGSVRLPPAMGFNNELEGERGWGNDVGPGSRVMKDAGGRMLGGGLALRVPEFAARSSLDHFSH